MSEFSKDIQISIEVAAELFTNLIVKTYQGVSGFVKDKNKEHDFFGKATKKYVGGLIGRYNTIQVLGMREPVPLKSLFVRANILEKISARAGLRPEELAEFFDFDRRAFGKKMETVDGEIIINKLHKFIVLGKPGAGKTTYLKYLTLMMLDPHSQIERRGLPIFVTLRSWADESVPLIDFIAQEFDTCGFEEAKTFVERMLKDGECVLLFDGLDEVSETAKQDDIIRQIKKFVEKYAGNRFIISCRVAAYNHWFEGFTEVEMADFNKEQMKTFIRNWFQGEPKVADECWNRLKKSPPLRELASVPLLLTLLCLEYGESNDFPPNRAELYHRAIETLLTKWDSSRRIRRLEVYKKLTIKQKESMFARIAWGTFPEHVYFIREMKLTRMIEKYVEHLPSFKEEELEPDSKAILKAIEAQHGIFVERAKGVYSFAHLTFQEYFTAKYITNNTREGILKELVERHLYDAKWKEVFLLSAGLLDDADELLLLMRRRADRTLDIPEINALMNAAVNSILPRDNKYPITVRRSLATSFSLARAFVLVRNRNRPQEYPVMHALKIAFSYSLECAFAITNAFNFAHIPNIHYSNIVSSAQMLTADLGQELGLDIFKAYGSGIDRLSVILILELQHYFYANTLIIDCLESSNFVSKHVREKMLHEICLPKWG